MQELVNSQHQSSTIRSWYEPTVCSSNLFKVRAKVGSANTKPLKYAAFVRWISWHFISIYLEECKYFWCTPCSPAGIFLSSLFRVLHILKLLEWFPMAQHWFDQWWMWRELQIRFELISDIRRPEAIVIGTLYASLSASIMQRIRTFPHISLKEIWLHMCTLIDGRRPLHWWSSCSWEVKLHSAYYWHPT